MQWTAVLSSGLYRRREGLCTDTLLVISSEANHASVCQRVLIAVAAACACMLCLNVSVSWPPASTETPWLCILEPGRAHTSDGMTRSEDWTECILHSVQAVLKLRPLLKSEIGFRPIPVESCSSGLQLHATLSALPCPGNLSLPILFPPITTYVLQEGSTRLSSKCQVCVHIPYTPALKLV